MMNDFLINRTTLLEILMEKNRQTCNGPISCLQMIRIVNSVPAVEVEPVRQEHWIVKQHSKSLGDYTCFCSGCKTEGSPIWKRCPVCEAKMTKEVQE